MSHELTPQELRERILPILLAEAYAYHERDLREHPELYGDVLRERFQAGALVPGAEYMQAQRLRAEICRETAGVLEQVDVLATSRAYRRWPCRADSRRRGCRSHSSSRAAR